MKKVLIATLACCTLATASFAQQRKKTTTAKRTVAAREDDDDDNDVADPGVMDSRSFYRTPYRSRNSGSFNKNVQLLSLGFGFPNTLYNGYDYYRLATGTNRSGFGPIMVKYERAIRDEVGIGAIAEFATRRWRYDVGFNRYTDKAVGFGISLLGYYHFNKFIPIRKLDVYAGLGININHVAYKNDYTNETDGFVDVWPAGVAGARYLFTPKFNAYAELGRTNYSWVNLGIGFRF